jgi:predicted DNA-binding ribbon-helix-helix protein
MAYQRLNVHAPERKQRSSAAKSTGTVSKQENLMKSPVVKRSIVIAGHKTSVSLEDAFWNGLKEIAGKRDLTLSDMVATIDKERRHGNLSSAIRLFVLDYYRGNNPLAESKTPGVGAGRGEPALRAE